MDIEAIKKQALELLDKAQTSEEANDLKVRFLGRKGELTSLLRELSTLSPEERKTAGQLLNVAKTELEEAFDAKLLRLESSEKQAQMVKERIDVTLPGRKNAIGTMHPISIVMDDISEIFHKLGFEIKQGPIMEQDFYNFEQLNIPKWHPARAMQDTFYFDPETLLRTHTSPVQIRTMMSQQPPVRMIAMGMCHRRDAQDASHSPYFHQVEGLMIDKHVSFSDLAGIISIILSSLFGGDVKVKFLPSYFPFVEPGAETLASCPFCGQKGCRVCQNSGWIEMGGSGMVNPKVLENVGYDPEQYQGFAFGWGIERIAMLKFGISDIRDFYTNDLRFLTQYGGAR